MWPAIGAGGDLRQCDGGQRLPPAARFQPFGSPPPPHPRVLLRICVLCRLAVQPLFSNWSGHRILENVVSMLFEFWKFVLSKTCTKLLTTGCNLFTYKFRLCCKLSYVNLKVFLFRTFAWWKAGALPQRQACSSIPRTHHSYRPLQEAYLASYVLYSNSQGRSCIFTLCIIFCITQICQMEARGETLVSPGINTYHP